MTPRRAKRESPAFPPSARHPATRALTTPGGPASLRWSPREFATYLRNNEERIPNFGERHRVGETITTAFVELTVNQVTAKRLVTKQQMRWTPRGGHVVLQIRTKVLNNELTDVFRRWYPEFRPAAAAA